MQGAPVPPPEATLEVFKVVLVSPLLIGTRNKMLETGGLVELPVMDTSTFSCYMMANPQAHRWRVAKHLGLIAVGVSLYS
jgi:hypothetical protein